MLVFGGKTASSYLNDLWLFNYQVQGGTDNSTPLQFIGFWEEKTPAEHQPCPCPRLGHSAVVCQVDNREAMIVFGGEVLCI